MVGVAKKAQPVWLRLHSEISLEGQPIPAELKNYLVASRQVVYIGGAMQDLVLEGGMAKTGGKRTGLFGRRDGLLALAGKVRQRDGSYAQCQEFGLAVADGSRKVYSLLGGLPGVCVGSQIPIADGAPVEGRGEAVFVSAFWR